MLFRSNDTAYEIVKSDWSSDVCSSDLPRGKVIDYRVPIEMEGVRINDGDILVGDIDGVCVVPREIEDEVFTRALEKARGERMVLKKIQEGMKARDAFDTYGIM